MEIIISTSSNNQEELSYYNEGKKKIESKTKEVDLMKKQYNTEET